MNTLKVNGIEVAYDSFGDESDQAIVPISGLGRQMIRWTIPFCQELASRLSGTAVIR